MVGGILLQWPHPVPLPPLGGEWAHECRKDRGILSLWTDCEVTLWRKIAIYLPWCWWEDGASRIKEHQINYTVNNTPFWSEPDTSFVLFLLLWEKNDLTSVKNVAPSLFAFPTGRSELSDPPSPGNSSALSSGFWKSFFFFCCQWSFC